MENPFSMNLSQSVKKWIFHQIHSNNLVYNTCWEDPRCDRQLLDIKSNSEIVMITSAGCNALAYLLDNPSQINCIDVNSRQNALLELKKSSFQKGDFNAHFQLFGRGKMEKVENYYSKNLKPYLPSYAYKYWDKNINFFNGKGIRKSFYYHGSSGLVALFAKSIIQLKSNLNRQVIDLFNSSYEYQWLIYEQIEREIFTPFVGWLLNRNLTMSMVGVPQSQLTLVREEYENGVQGYIQECFNHVFSNLPISENYFWHLYLFGAYSKECCPEYLKAHNFQSIKSKVSKIQTHTKTISQFLKDNPGEYSHFILLDHQDWLASNDRDALHEEWDLILKNARKGSKILLRSATKEVDFIPDFVMKKVEFEKERTKVIHKQDRVGTYASVCMGIVK